MFTNPLWAPVLADPFVLRFNRRYYAYGTPGSGPLPVLRSTDLVGWEYAGDVLAEAPDGSHWAPEVAYDNGRFFLYFSTGGPEGEHHRLRVAEGPSPTGPFGEAVLLDPDDPFTIDAHPFRDDDGAWYLYYSRDFLDGERVGTGVVVDRLVDMSTLAGERRTVLRPHAEWHVYERSRRWYDRVWDWYTVEGPFVRKHGGRYWCFYSGGAWRAENYGVSFAVADHPLGPFQPASASEGADVLRTVPGRVIGPGHCSVAEAPDNLSEYLVYHAWDPGLTGRRMCADPLVWVDGRPSSPGPSTEPQHCPPPATFSDLFDGTERSLDRRHWSPSGRWHVEDGEAVARPQAAAPVRALALVEPDSHYLLEVNACLRGGATPGRAYGAVISHQDDSDHTVVVLEPAAGCLRWRRIRDGRSESGAVLADLPDGFVAGAYHRLLLRREGDGVHATLDGMRCGVVPPEHSGGGGAVGLFADVPAAFAGVALTNLSSTS